MYSTAQMMWAGNNDPWELLQHNSRVQHKCMLLGILYLANCIQRWGIVKQHTSIETFSDIDFTAKSERLASALCTKLCKISDKNWHER